MFLKKTGLIIFSSLKRIVSHHWIVKILISEIITLAVNTIASDSSRNSYPVYLTYRMRVQLCSSSLPRTRGTICTESDRVCIDGLSLLAYSFVLKFFAH